MKRERGFTLPELLAVAAFSLVLIGAMLLLLRPKDYSAVKRNAQRRTDLAQIMMAINAYRAENGALPPNIKIQETAIASEEDESSLCNDLVPKYAKDLPLDPEVGLAIMEGSCDQPDQLYATGYTVKIDLNGKVTLAAPAAENGETISLTN